MARDERKWKGTVRHIVSLSQTRSRTGTPKTFRIAARGYRHTLSLLGFLLASWLPDSVLMQVVVQAVQEHLHGEHDENHSHETLDRAGTALAENPSERRR